MPLTSLRLWWYAQCALHVELQGELKLEYATAREVGHVFCGCTKCNQPVLLLLHNDRKNLFQPLPLPPPPPAATPENGGDVLCCSAGIISNDAICYDVIISYYSRCRYMYVCGEDMRGDDHSGRSVLID